MATRGSEYKVGSHVQYETDGGWITTIANTNIPSSGKFNNTEKKSVITMYIKKTSEDEKFTL